MRARSSSESEHLHILEGKGGRQALDVLALLRREVLPVHEKSAGQHARRKGAVEGANLVAAMYGIVARRTYSCATEQNQEGNQRLGRSTPSCCRRKVDVKYARLHA